MSTPNGAAAKVRDDDLEKAMVGYLLTHGKEFDNVRGSLMLEDFQDVECRYVYRAVCAVAESGATPDLLTVTDELERGGNLARAGGHDFVARLTTDTIETSQVELYCRKLRALTIRRTILSVTADLYKQASDPKADPIELLSEAERVLLGVTGDRLRDPYQDSYAICMALVNDMERRSQLGNRKSGILSGYEPLDEMTDGFQNSDYIVIGARPSVGKTAFALSMATNQAFRYGVSVGFFSLEMTTMAMGYRILSGESHIEHNRLRSVTISHAERSKLLDAQSRISQAKLYMSDVPNMPFSEIRSIARRMKARHGIGILYVDYISLIEPDDHNLPRHEQIASVSRGLKQLARELAIPVIALSQLRRETEGRKPCLADLRESGSIEQDADLVILLHREDTENTGDTTEVECVLAKHRNGATGLVSMVLRRPFVRFELRERHG